MKQNDVLQNDALATAFNAITHLGLTLEVCGTWGWISGDTKSHQDVLKAAGFLWASKKMRWYFRPEKSKARRGSEVWSMEKIRTVYGSKKVAET